MRSHLPIVKLKRELNMKSLNYNCRFQVKFRQLVSLTIILNSLSQFEEEAFLNLVHRQLKLLKLSNYHTPKQMSNKAYLRKLGPTIRTAIKCYVHI